MNTPHRHHRRSIRLARYDYTQPGAYFLTIRCQRQGPAFGTITNGIVRLNEIGLLVQQCWLAIPQHFPTVQLDESVVMPDHIHGIASIIEESRAHPAIRPAALPGEAASTTASILPVQASVGTIVATFKAAVTRNVRQTMPSIGPLWQRNYYEHVIRNEHELRALREYIRANPIRWHEKLM